MKVFKLEKRLVLGKETISHLMQSESNAVKGGGTLICPPRTYGYSECEECIYRPETILCS